MAIVPKNKPPVIRVQHVPLAEMPEWYKEDHERLKTMETKLIETAQCLAVHTGQSVALEKMVLDHESILRGDDMEGGLLADHARIKTNQKVIIGVLGTVITAVLAGVGWVIQYAIHLSNAVTAIIK